MKILYITYVDFLPTQFGAAMRPQKMYRAFLDEGHEVKLLSGSQKRADREKRAAAVEEISRWLDTNTPDICYIESPYYPILWSFDRRLIRKIHRLGIPIGYFYRDFPHKVSQPPVKGRGFARFIKDEWLSFSRRQTDNLLKCVDIVYLPTEPAKELFSYRDMRALPPAGENHLHERQPEGHTCIYVEGIVGNYDGIQLLDTFHILNESGTEYRLILVCRKAEWDTISHPDKEAQWLEVHHVSGDELAPLYRRASLAMCLNTVNPYDRYSVSVKLYEYMSYGLPVIVNAAPEMERLTKENGTGLAVPYGAENAVEAVHCYFSDEELQKNLRSNIEKTLTENNLWIHRVRQVVSDLQKKK